jgi:MFS family permease
MFFSNRKQKLRDVYDEYPQQFWLLIGAAFIDMIGNALLFPFMALFFTQEFDVGMTEVGYVFGIVALAGLFGGTVGGALADRTGRKPVFLFALITSALINLAIVLINDFRMMYVLAAFAGVFGSVGGPAAQAMIADILPEEKRAEGFGIIRVVFNLAVTIGPMIGGLLAGVSYLLLFIIDSITSLITAAILLVMLKETKPEASPDAPEETVADTFRGYGHVFRDLAFVAFALIGMLVQVVYIQMNTTLPVYLRDFHDIPPQGFGVIITLNAGMVVLFQFGITRRLRERADPPLLVIAVGTLLYAIGFAMYGFFALFFMFLLAMVIITIGEMLIAPVGQAMAAKFAPEDMRGRYMAIYGFSFSISSGVGTILAGLVIDGIGADWVWYLAGIGGTVAALGYVALYRRLALTRSDVVAATPPPVPAPAAATTAATGSSS